MQKYIKYIALIIVCLFAAGTLLAPSHKELKDVKVNLKVLYQAKVIHDLDKTVESLDASERVFVTFKWQDYEMKPKYTHQIWLTYTNDDGEEVTYECEPPVW